MKKYLSSALLGSFLLLASPILLTYLAFFGIREFKMAAEANVPAGYSLVWQDDFIGSTLDTSKWSVKTGQGASADIQYSPEAIAVANGIADLTTYTENGTHYSGWISTENKYHAQYGYLEARIQFNPTDKLGMAYWLFHPLVNVYGDPWNHGVEMDIVEHTKYNWQGTDVSNKASSSLNWGQYGSDWENHPVRTSGDRGSGLATGYHTYAVEWTPTTQKYYIDGQYLWQVNNSTASPVSRRDQFFILSHHPGGGSANYGAKVGSTAKMKVDYVKVYQLNPIPPPAPTNLTKRGGSGNVILSWDLAANATSYTIKRAPHGSSPRTYTNIGTTTNLTYTDTSASAGSSYYYTVAAVNSSGPSGNSGEILVNPNLALQKPAFSSPSSRQPASLAFDGNKSTFWESVWAVDPQWIYVDLQNAIYINGVTFDWTDAFAKSYTIDTSLDGSSWTTVYTTISGDGGTDEINFYPRSARYVRLHATERAHTYVNPSPFGYGLNEFNVHFLAVAPAPTKLAGYTNNSSVKLKWNQVAGASYYTIKRASSSGGPYTTAATNVTGTSYTDSQLTNGTTYYHAVTATGSFGEGANSNETRTIPRANIALWQQAEASSKLNTDTQPYKAFDGMNDTYEGVTSSWSSAFSDNQWILADLQTTYPVNRVKLVWDPVFGHGSVFDIQVSTDKANWTTVYTMLNGTGGTNDVSFTPTNARYVRIFGRQRGHVYGYSLKEFEIYAQ